MEPDEEHMCYAQALQSSSTIPTDLWYTYIKIYGLSSLTPVTLPALCLDYEV